ncbi:class I SAM-dependent methyltransferase [Paenibacillus cremeus]|nr:class I SAM-dependent methyltransferase [Paenibacillus cremeus]
MSMADYLKAHPVVAHLNTLHNSIEGNLLHSEPQTSEAQIHFLQYALSLAKPKKILETGTNKGFFSFLLSHLIKDVDLYTFDIDPRSKACVDYLNKCQSNVRIHLQLGDTRQTLLRFHQQGIGFAWIDGGHQWDTAYSDIMHAIRLGVPYIAIDDVAFPGAPDLPHVVAAILAAHPRYVQAANPFAANDLRGAVLLERKD